MQPLDTRLSVDVSYPLAERDISSPADAPLSRPGPRPPLPGGRGFHEGSPSCWRGGCRLRANGMYFSGVGWRCSWRDCATHSVTTGPARVVRAANRHKGLAQRAYFRLDEANETRAIRLALSLWRHPSGDLADANDDFVYWQRLVTTSPIAIMGRYVSFGDANGQEPQVCRT